MRSFLFTFLLSFISILSYGQDQWLVTTKQDTLYGKIFLNTGDPYRIDELRLRQDDEKSTYKAYEVKWVQLDEGDEYSVLKIDERYQFVQIELMSKYMSAYSYVDTSVPNSTNFALKILVNWEGDQYKLSNLTSKKKFAEFFENCEAVSERILSGDLKKKNLEEVFSAYDQCMIKMEEQIIEEVFAAEEPNTSVDVLQPFIEDLKSQDLYQGELITMLEDISRRLSKKESIPNYLQNAVLDQLEGQETLKKDFLDLLK